MLVYVLFDKGKLTDIEAVISKMLCASLLLLDGGSGGPHVFLQVVTSVKSVLVFGAGIQDRNHF